MNQMTASGRYFNFGFGYHVVSKFQQPIGNLDNFSGIEFSMGMGLILGRGV